MSQSEIHFDQIAKDYDFWKQKNSFYYDNLKALLKSYIKEGSYVLEIGCGTGDLLQALSPKIGRGWDISQEMIEIARKRQAGKHNLSFERADIYESNKPFEADWIFMSDVLEHVEDNQKFIKTTYQRMKKGSRLIVTLANPLWEPVLMLAEKLGMKMPEGPHERIPIAKLDEYFRASGFEVIEKNFRLLVPKKTIISDWVNKRFYKFKVLKNLGFTVYWVLEK